MQIKVKDTRMHRVAYYKPTPQDIGREQAVPVAEAKLVLVKAERGRLCEVTFSDGEGNHYIHAPNEDAFIHFKDYEQEIQPFKPILISETEKIEVGDWYIVELFDITGKSRGLTIEMVQDINGIWVNSKDITTQRHIGNCKKILALPEHFSPKHLQAIVEGKLKDGDRVLVECENKAKYSTSGKEFGAEEFAKANMIIKLNSSNHITLHKVEEKMIAMSQAIQYAKDFGLAIINKGWSVNDIEEWFKENVK